MVDRLDAMSLKTMHVLMSHRAVGTQKVRAILAESRGTLARFATGTRVAGHRGGNLKHSQWKRNSQKQRTKSERFPRSQGESDSGGDEDVLLGLPKMRFLSSLSWRDKTDSKP